MRCPLKKWSLAAAGSTFDTYFLVGDVPGGLNPQKMFPEVGYGSVIWNVNLKQAGCKSTSILRLDLIHFTPGESGISTCGRKRFEKTTWESLLPSLRILPVEGMQVDAGKTIGSKSVTQVASQSDKNAQGMARLLPVNPTKLRKGLDSEARSFPKKQKQVKHVLC